LPEPPLLPAALPAVPVAVIPAVAPLPVVPPRPAVALLPPDAAAPSLRGTPPSSVRPVWLTEQLQNNPAADANNSARRSDRIRRTYHRSSGSARPDLRKRFGDCRK